MLIGVPREIKQEEHRVSVTPAGVAALTASGHAVLVEAGAGAGSGFSDDEYGAAGAGIVDRPTVFRKAQLIVKVKEPLPQEYDLFQDGQGLFTFLHLAANRPLVQFLVERRITAIGYETITRGGMLPLLEPMSEIAGRMAPLMAAYFLQKFAGGSGILCTGATGVPSARAVILGAGVVGSNAARVCLGLGIETLVMNKTVDRLKRIDELFGGGVRTMVYSPCALEAEIVHTDILIGAVLVPGGRTPLLMRREMLGRMKKGSVIVDVSVDQGGCVETARPTTHADPVYLVDGILHYAVANMPGAFPRTSTLALTNATLPYILRIAEHGVDVATHQDDEIRSGLNTYGGDIVSPAVAAAVGGTA